jgi:hypothetical protein
MIKMPQIPMRRLVATFGTCVEGDCISLRWGAAM